MKHDFNYKELMKKLPFGIICGSNGIIAFFSLIGTVISYVILSGIAAQTNKTITLFENWWQTLLFVVCVISTTLMIVTFVLFILKTKNNKQNENNDLANKNHKSIFSCSVWTMLTIFFTLLTTFFSVGTSIALDNAAPINKTLGVDAYVKVQTGQGAGEKAERFSSDFIEKTADGKPIYQTDSSGNKSTIKNNKTMRENSKKVSEQVAVEGTVLLWNNNEALPLQTTDKISLFGIASAKDKYAVSGYGSGEIKTTPTDEKLSTALENKGFSINKKLDERYEYFTDENIKKGNFNYGLHAGRWPNSNFKPVYCTNEVPWNEVESIANETLDTYSTAVYVISRRAGEDQDIIDNIENNETDVDGGMNHLELSKDEAEVLLKLAEKKQAGSLKKIIVLLNTANPLQFKEIIKDKYSIDACVWTGIGGTESLVQVADVLSNSNYITSGHAPDTLLMDNHLAPATVNFGDYTWTNDDIKEKLKDLPYLNDEYKYYYQTHNLKYMVYQEGIYVGYKYFETRYEDYVINRNNANGSNGSFNNNNWNYKNEVAFPFGYGLSYTEFERTNPTFIENENDYNVSLNIKNIGTKYAGKDVLQVYLSKPYTDYDKQNGVEKASVELVGFAKTDVLQTNGEETLNVTIDKEALKTYDSYGKKTYILEKGDYYLAIGTDAHDANNNILAKKGYTPSNTDNRMDSKGNPEMVYKITIDNDDFEKYSKNDKDVEITNRFDDADINLYSGTKDDQNIKYLSRSNWQDTYPLNPVNLKCENETMVYDMQYGHEVKVKDGDVMPKYETITSSTGALNLAMLEDYDYNNPLWEDLLNQMSFKEQVIMMNYGMGLLAGAETIGAPGLKATDGPQGLYHTKYAFPSPTMSAASFNTELVKKLGNAYAHEALHSGYTMVYAPGGNIHRTLYSGRNFEYYSEDGVLGGKMLASQVKGMREKGIIVCSKHFAFNDQETNRYGVATFFNEQSAREIYLKVFEIGVREGNMNGLMSSFNRIGCTWTGRHHGLLTDILRNEWGFIGIVETDACSGAPTTPHMEDKWAVAEGLVAGNDVWMSRGSDSMLNDSKNNPTVMLALREACHRVLYTQLHSAAINGITVNTKMIKITPWWESTLYLITTLMVVGMSVSLIMSVLSFINKCKKKKIDTKQDNTKVEKPKKFNTKTVNIITSSTIAFVFAISGTVSSLVYFAPNPDLKNYAAPGELHECVSHCPVCGSCTNYECEDPVCSNKCKCTSISIEAESDYVERIDGTATWGGMHVGHDEVRNLNYVAGLDGNANAKINFKFLAETEGRTLLNATIRRRPWNFNIQEFLNVYINDEKIDYETTLPGTCENATYHTDDGTDGKGDFYSFDIKNFETKKGLNVISFVVSEKSGGQCPNFDKIDLISSSVIKEYQHICNSKCLVCGKCTNYECTDDIVCLEKCECTNLVVEAESNYVERTKKDGTPLNLGKSEDEQIEFIKDLNSNGGAKVTFKVISEKVGKSLLKATLRMMPWEFLLQQYVGLQVNGEEVEYSSKLPKDEDASHDTPSKCDFTTVNLSLIDIKEGINTITIYVKETTYPQCPDIDKISLFSNVPLIESTHLCESKCSLCGKCTDLNCDNIVCLEKCECKETIIEAESTTVDKFDKNNNSLNIGIENDITFIKDLNGNGGATIRFKFDANNEGKALLKANLRMMPWVFSLNQYVDIYVNDELFTYSCSLPKDENTSHDTPSKCDFATVNIATINLLQGTNIVTFVVKDGTYPQCPDFDKVMFVGPIEISEYSHVCNSKCPECGKCTNKDCTDKIVCLEKCECKKTIIEAESESVIITQAENPLWGGVSKGVYSDTNTGYLKVENDNAGSSFTFNITSNKEGLATLYVYVTPKKYIDYKLNEQSDLIINGTQITYESETVLKDESLEDNHWATYFNRIKVARISLKEGNNTITFKTKGWHGLMMDKIELYSDATINEK